jgi:hypothetical protein
VQAATPPARTPKTDLKNTLKGKEIVIILIENQRYNEL